MINLFDGEGRNISTPLGNRVLFTDDDLLEVIKENGLDDVAYVTELLINDLSEENVYEKERARTDADSFEASCEEYRDMLLEVQEFIEKILKNMDEHPRMKKDTIYNELHRIPKRINTIL